MRIPSLSLQQRMTLGTGLMLVPLLMLGGAGYALYLQTIDAFEMAMQRSMRVVLPVSELQRRILETDRPLDQYLYGTSPQEREAFSSQAQSIERQFDALMGKSELLADYHTEIFRARQQWQQVEELANTIMQRHAAAEGVTLEMLVRLEALQQKTTAILDHLYYTFEGEIEHEYRNALQDRQQIQLLLLSIFAGGVVIAVLTGHRLARRVLTPLDKLREGTERFGNGDLGYRIQIGNDDEFGQLAKTFNEMADQLEFLASYDSLTGLLNKREFEVRLNDEVRRARRARHPFVLLLQDLDDFKLVNDTHGHQAGDQALQKLAALLKTQVRDADYIGRYGGEEFGIILTDTSEQDGRETAERIRQVVEAEQFVVNEDIDIRITMSIGLACYPDDAANADALIARADEALYRAKEEGRNQVVAFSNS